MSNDMLSQDEIDALLRGGDDADDVSEDIVSEDVLSEMEEDALGEIGNISFGSSATALSTLLNQKVDITTPKVSVISKSDLVDEFPQPNVAIKVSYTEGFSGSNVLVIKQSDAAIIADLMLGGDGTNPADLMGEIQISAVQEAMNQMMGSAATSMSTIFSKKVDISPPFVEVLDILHGGNPDVIIDDDQIVKVSFNLRIGELIDSNIMQLLPLDFAKSLVYELMNPTPAASEHASTIEAPVLEKQQDVVMNQGMNHQQENNIQNNHNQNNIVQEIPQEHYMQQQQDTRQTGGQSYMPNSAQQSSPQHFGGAYSQGVQANVQPAVFSSFEPYPLQETEAKNLDMLLDIPLQVTVELGRTKRSVKEILELSQGSIIELDKLAGEPVDIHINNRLIAKGEVVVIDENFGVRVTDIISQSDRLKKLR